VNPDDRIEARMIELRDKGHELANAAAQRYSLDHARKAVIALAMKTAEQKGVKTAAAQERDALASAEYETWRRGATEAVREHERLRMEWEVVKLRFEHWRTTQATRRAEMQYT
jgi:hypothetical protein